MSLAKSPFVPLFVFDGRERPRIKSSPAEEQDGQIWVTTTPQGMKELLRLFGMQWIAAKGEAEAELARLNRLGIIDAMMTDVVDALVFGARTVIKNQSLNLSGNKPYPAVNKEGKQSHHHINIYVADAIGKETGLTTGGMVLFALFAGGDNDDGVNQCGPALAHGLARAGYGNSLLQAFHRRNEQDIRPFLRQWCEAVAREINTNSRGFLAQRQASFALPVDFPNLDVLNAYANPVCHSSHEHLTDRGKMSIPHLAAFCEEKFTEWGTLSMIIKRFRDLIWEAGVIRVLRRAALEADDQERSKRRASGNEDRPGTAIFA
ncbi:PIN domain-like protein [Armillaria mellea]|nr:PIN domain-like protein [Armillaria mellea]